MEKIIVFIPKTTLFDTYYMLNYLRNEHKNDKVIIYTNASNYNELKNVFKKYDFEIRTSVDLFRFTDRYDKYYKTNLFVEKYFPKAYKKSIKFWNKIKKEKFSKMYINFSAISKIKEFDKNIELILFSNKYNQNYWDIVQDSSRYLELSFVDKFITSIPSVKEDIYKFSPKLGEKVEIVDWPFNKKDIENYENYDKAFEHLEDYWDWDFDKLDLAKNSIAIAIFLDFKHLKKLEIFFSKIIEETEIYWKPISSDDKLFEKLLLEAASKNENIKLKRINYFNNYFILENVKEIICDDFCYNNKSMINATISGTTKFIDWDSIN